MNANNLLKSRIVLKFGTQENFSQSTGIKSSTISSIVTGRRQATECQRNLIARALNIQPEIIFPEEYVLT